MLYGENTSWQLFNMIDVDYDSDHRLLKGKLIAHKGKTYHQYMKDRKTLPVELFPLELVDGPSEVDRRFQTLKEALDKPKEIEKEDKSWISAQSFELLRRKAQALR